MATLNTTAEVYNLVSPFLMQEWASSHLQVVIPKSTAAVLIMTAELNVPLFCQMQESPPVIH